MLQGLSVGGQLMSSLVFTVEGHPESKWGLYGSCVMAAGNFGTFLGGVTAYELRSKLTEAQLIQWGWRIPFLSGIFISICGVYLKYFCEDDEVLPGHAPVPTDDVMPENTDDNDDGELVEIINDDIANARPQPVNPLREAFSRENRRSLVATAFVPMVWSGGFYISFVWMAIFMQDLVHPPVPSAFGINSWSLLLLGLWFPVAGLLSDFFGRKRIMTIGGVSFGLLGPIMILLIGKKGNQSSWIAFLCQTVLGISLAFWGAPMCAWLVESFEPQARLTSVSIGYNISQALAGGMSPFFATLLVDKVGLGGPGILLFVLAIVSMTGLWVIAPSRRDHGMLLITASEIQEDNIIMEERSHSGLELKEIS
jgi:MHS family proline/betaine transporter-like MFS transporter